MGLNKELKRRSIKVIFHLAKTFNALIFFLHSLFQLVKYYGPKTV